MIAVCALLTDSCRRCAHTFSTTAREYFGVGMYLPFAVRCSVISARPWAALSVVFFKGSKITPGDFRFHSSSLGKVPEKS